MRIIGGEARGRTLVAPPGSGTRPTQDYVRESLFNILAPRVPGARVMDCFAGTGALSLEALSRGAAFAALMEKNRQALSAIRRNIEAVGCGDRLLLLPGDWRDGLARLSGQPPFDLLFLDPPYRMTETGGMLSRIVASGLAAGDALFVVEHRRGQAPSLPEGLAFRDRRRYGETEISFIVRRPQEG